MIVIDGKKGPKGPDFRLSMNYNLFYILDRCMPSKLGDKCFRNQKVKSNEEKF